MVFFKVFSDSSDLRFMPLDSFKFHSRSLLMDLFTKRRSFRGGLIRLDKSLQRLALGFGGLSSLVGVPATITGVGWFNIV